jgi:hypothetical protein
MATAANVVKFKRSAVPGKVPATTDLNLGEIALNTYDGRIYLKKSVALVETVVTLQPIGTGSGLVVGDTSPTLNSPTINNPTFAGTFAFTSTNSTTPAMTLTANNLNDGVGILRVTGSEPDIVFNQVLPYGGYNTFTFEFNGVPKLALGRRSDNSFYITRNDGVWHDNAFVLDYATGVLSVESGISVPTVYFSDETYQTTAWLGSVTQLVNGDKTLTLNSDGSVQFPYYKFPAADGTTGQTLVTDGAGNLTWATLSGGGGGAVYSVNYVAQTLTLSQQAQARANIDAISTGDAFIYSLIF